MGHGDRSWPGVTACGAVLETERVDGVGPQDGEDDSLESRDVCVLLRVRVEGRCVPDSAPALADAVPHLAVDVGSRRSLAAAASERSRMFRWDAVFDALFAEYAEVTLPVSDPGSRYAFVDQPLDAPLQRTGTLQFPRAWMVEVRSRMRHAIEVTGESATLYISGVFRRGDEFTLNRICHELPARVRMIRMDLHALEETGPDVIAGVRGVLKHWRETRGGSFRLSLSTQFIVATYAEGCPVPPPAGGVRETQGTRSSTAAREIAGS